MNKLEKKNRTVQLNGFVLVDIRTPYLGLDYKVMERIHGEELPIQIALAGYNPNGILKHGTILQAGNLEVAIAYRVPKELPFNLRIAGCAEESESEVREMKQSGVPVARFSIFYGKPSRYTGFSAEESGYSFDFPKSNSIVRSFLTDEACMGSILQRSERRIRRSIDSLNKRIEAPIIVTPYLSEALKIKVEEIQ